MFSARMTMNATTSAAPVNASTRRRLRRIEVVDAAEGIPGRHDADPGHQRIDQEHHRARAT